MLNACTGNFKITFLYKDEHRIDFKQDLFEYIIL